MVDALRPQRNLEMDPDGPPTQRREVEELRLRRMDDLNQDDVVRVRKLQVEEMELRDIRGINPEIVLLAYPLAEGFALHRLGADLERSFPQDLLGRAEVLEGDFPALGVGPLRGTSGAGQASPLLQMDVLPHEFFGLGLRVVIPLGQSAEQILDVSARQEQSMNDAEIGDRCWIDVEERQPLGTP